MSQITGASQIAAKLRELDVKVSKKITNKAVRDSIKLSMVDVKASFLSQGLVQTGAMVRGVAIGRRRESEGKVAYVLGVRADDSFSRKLGTRLTKGQRKRGDDPFYWRFLELGTKNIPAKNIIRNTFKGNEQKMLAKLISVYKTEIKELE